MGLATADIFYTISSAIVIIATLIFLFRSVPELKDRRFILWLALLSFISLVTFLVVFSISFDFGKCPNPSREFPYFTSGRSLDAAVVPFFLLFVYAIDRFSGEANRKRLRWILLGAIALFLIVSQLQVNAPAFSSRYNFFHRDAL